MNNFAKIILISGFTITTASAQTDTLQILPPSQIPSLKISGYLETYYSYGAKPGTYKSELR
jgi:hypothetical protein